MMLLSTEDSKTDMTTNSNKLIVLGEYFKQWWVFDMVFGGKINNLLKDMVV